MTEDLNWREKLAQKFWAVKVGERAENLRQAATRFNNVNSLTMATREKLMGKEVTDNNRPEGEDMHIGDDNSVIHQYLQPQQQQGSVMGSLAKLALGAGLITTGIGVPAGGYMIWDALKNRPTPATMTDTDTNTEYEVELLP
ncbi:hypothetical protein [Gimesia sp.]|uniref:hypothetical protein n=1 Tax=Gimesia sp. TaxID=2024833 RepID=UPI003A938169